MESKGLGDDIEGLLKTIGISNIVEKTTEFLGINDCGCTRRKENLNRIFPHRPKHNDSFIYGKYLVKSNFIVNKKPHPLFYSGGEIIFVDNEDIKNELKIFFEQGLLIWN